MKRKDGKVMIRNNISYIEDFFDKLGRINTSLRKRNMPNYGYIEVTGRCNFRCLHCFFNRTKEFQRKGEMSYREICSVMRQFADMGIVKILITGGEPFLRPDIFKILDYAKDLGFVIDINTNASLITEEVAARLKDYGIIGVHVSLYGLTEESHKAITGSSHTFEKVVKAIDLLTDLWKKRQIIHVDFNPCLFYENFSDLDEIERFRNKMRKIGITTIVKWSWHVCRDQTCGPFRHKLTNSQYEELCRRMPDVLGWPADYIIPDEPVCVLGGGQDQVYVNCWGNVLPCPRVSKGVNMRKKPIKEIIEKDPLFVSFRKLTWKDLTKCYACEKKEFCTPCQADFLQNSGDLNSLNDVKAICDFKNPGRRKKFYEKYRLGKK